MDCVCGGIVAIEERIVLMGVLEPQVWVKGLVEEGQLQKTPRDNVKLCSFHTHTHTTNIQIEMCLNTEPVEVMSHKVDHWKSQHSHNMNEMIEHNFCSFSTN